MLFQALTIAPEPTFVVGFLHMTCMGETYIDIYDFEQNIYVARAEVYPWSIHPSQLTNRINDNS